MLSTSAQKNLFRIIALGCKVKLLPYQWDSVKYNFTTAPLWHAFIYQLHVLAGVGMGIFSGARLALTFQRGADPVPCLVRTMAMSWTLAYMIQAVCFFQMFSRQEQIRFLANSLFDFIRKDNNSGQERINAEADGTEIVDSNDETQDQEVEADSKNERKKTNWISRCTLIGIVMLIVNPPIHSILVIETPCAPQFLSSAFLHCRNTHDNSATILQKTPFIMVELFLITDMLYSVFFLWALAFLWLAWSKLELQDLNRLLVKMEDSTTDLDHFVSKYRYVQTLLALLNDAFQYYLSWGPALVICITSFLTFGTIAFWRQSYLSYTMFPTCGLRCVFECFSFLSLAGMVNSDSSKLLQIWREESSKQSKLHSTEYNILSSKLLLSSDQIKCKAGAFYTFENSIVLTALGKYSDLTLNLLIMYK